MQRRGLGLHVFHRQVAAAAALGVARIELLAGRRREENGYYTWPRFGFEGVLPALLRRMLPVDLRAPNGIGSDGVREGPRVVARERSDDRRGFELAAGSRSRTALDRYVRQE